MEVISGSVTNMHGGALALWAHEVGEGKDLYGQAIGADARLLGDSFTLVGGERSQQTPALDGDGARFLLTWQSDADGNWDAHAALYQPEQVTVIAYSYDPLYRLTAAVPPPP